MRRQLGPAGGSLIDEVCDRREFRPVGHRLAQNFDRSGDDRKDVVEVVKYATGKLPHDDRFLNLILPDLARRWRRSPAGRGFQR